MTNSQPVGFAVLGLGMGQHHVRVLQKAPSARLIGVCDVREDRLKKVADAYGCKAWTSVDEMLQDPEVEVVNVCTPSGTHGEMTERVAQAHRHVLCEKPLEISPERVDRMIRICEEQKVMLGGIFQRRTSPLYARIREVVQNGGLGALATADVSLRWYRAQSYYEADGGWRGTWALDGGGSLMNQGVHSVDILQWVAGPVRSVTARCAVRAHQIETEDTTVAMLEFESGALGAILTTTCAYPGLYEDLNLHGIEGSIHVEDGVLKTWKLKAGSSGDAAGSEEEMMKRYGAVESGSGSADPMAVGLEGHEALIEDMARAVRDRRAPLIPGREGRKAVQLINAIYQSAREGRTVSLSEAG